MRLKFIQASLKEKEDYEINESIFLVVLIQNESTSSLLIVLIYSYISFIPLFAFSLSNSSSDLSISLRLSKLNSNSIGAYSG